MLDSLSEPGVSRSFGTCGVVHPVPRTRVGVTHPTAFPTVLLAFSHPFCRYFFSLGLLAFFPFGQFCNLFFWRVFVRGFFFALFSSKFWRPPLFVSFNFCLFFRFFGRSFRTPFLGHFRDVFVVFWSLFAIFAA